MRKVFVLSLAYLILLGGAAYFVFCVRYETRKISTIPLKEFSTVEYPEDPANRSINYRRYSNRKLSVIQIDNNHFDLILNSRDKETAKVIFKNIDLDLFATGQPEWTKKDKNLEIISLTDREWNRQQVSFDRYSKHLEIVGGDGYEDENLYSAEIAKNCLNAGLWEILLFTNENGNKTLYYQGWFTFPMGHYKNAVERKARISYWKHFWRLEHWVNPQGLKLNLQNLRKVVSEKEVWAQFKDNERVFAFGEQSRKLRTTDTLNIRHWKDFFDGRKIRFATFLPPGIYRVSKPWKNEYWRLAKFQGTSIKNIVSIALKEELHEIELRFEDSKTKEINKFIVGGINLKELPQLKVKDYFKGLYMPMGIGVPPFFQSYEELEQKPPYLSPYYSVFLNSRNEWLNHHDIAIDGSVIHRDINNSNILHFYLLSYERHSLIGHFLIEI